MGIYFFVFMVLGLAATLGVYWLIGIDNAESRFILYTSIIPGTLAIGGLGEILVTSLFDREEPKKGVSQ